MENQIPNVDVAATTATTPKLRRSVEDQAIENYIRDSERLLEAARLNADLSEKLAEYGFDDEELSYGMACRTRPGRRSAPGMVSVRPNARARSRN